MTFRLFPLSIALLLAVCATAYSQGGGFKPLFDGKSLSGFTVRSGKATYKVEDGVIVGTTAEGSGNTFLTTDREYSDFELTFEVKVDDALNSGVQIRSHVAPENGFQPKLGGKLPKDRLYGPQVEISTDGMAGRIYDEARRGRWLDTKAPTPETKTAFKKGEWNQYRVLAEGDRIQTWVNGVPVADTRDGEESKGHIGLQVHGIARGAGPFQVRWRNLMIRETGR
jgi:hypothetical protein